MAYDKFKILNSSAVPLNIDNVDTDQIIPARFLKATERIGFGDNLFRDWRYKSDGSPVESFPLNNKKYRVNQVQGFTHYGKSFAVNYIKNISQDFYEEDCIFEMQPDFLEDVISTHHFHTNGKFAVFDYCKNEKM